MGRLKAHTMRQRLQNNKQKQTNMHGKRVEHADSSVCVCLHRWLTVYPEPNNSLHDHIHQTLQLPDAPNQTGPLKEHTNTMKWSDHMADTKVPLELNLIRSQVGLHFIPMALVHRASNRNKLNPRKSIGSTSRLAAQQCY